MISNSWGKLELYCGNGHEEKMELKQKTSGIFYECPCCRNSFSMSNIEKFLDKIEDIVNEAEMNDEMLDVNHMEVKVGFCQYKIKENSEERMRVVGVNKKSLIH